MLENIHTLPYADWIHNLKLKELNWKPTVSPDFISHTLPTLASIPLIRNSKGKISPGKTMKNLENDTQIETPNGPVSANTIRLMIGFLFLAPRSSLIQGTLTKSPTLASLTPLPMYAHKLYNDVKYSEWDKKDPFIKYFLGSYLYPIVDYGTDARPRVTLELSEIKAMRTKALMYKTGKQAGSQAPLLSNKMNIKNIGTNRYTNVILQMLLQTWLANAAVRDTSSMILDPWDWDNIPKAIDATVAPVVAKPLTRETAEMEDYF